jgi:cell division protein FtsI/penicillin-binding protein 2
MDDGQMGDNINRTKVCRFDSCPDNKKNNHMAKEKLTSREEALKRIISQEEYDRVMESNRKWESDEIERNYRRMYAKLFYDSFPENGLNGGKL